MNKALFFVFSLLFVSLISNVVCQDDDYEDEEDEESDSESIPTTTRIPLAFYPFLSFAEQFRQLTEPKAQVAATAATSNNNATSANASPSPSNGTATETTRRPLRSTTEKTRMAEVGIGVNGILNSVTSFDIPGIVDNALSIRDYTPVRKLVKNILDGIFCLPVLNNLSDCGKRLAAANAEAAALNPTTTAKPRRRPSKRRSTVLPDTSTAIPPTAATNVDSIKSKSVTEKP